MGEIEFSGRRRPVVMTVDDDPVIHEMLAFALAEEFDLHFFLAAEQAFMQLELLRPDLLLMDIGLPGMDGYAACREFVAQFPVPVIFISGHDTLDERLRAFDAGACDFLVKPVAPEIVLYKCRIAVSQLQKERLLQSEKAELQASALCFLSDVAQSRALLDFVARGLRCQSLQRTRPLHSGNHDQLCLELPAADPRRRTGAVVRSARSSRPTGGIGPRQSGKFGAAVRLPRPAGHQRCQSQPGGE